jgi:hypothetical protein
MIFIFLVGYLFAIPIFALQIAKTGKPYKDIITTLQLSRQHCQPGHKALFQPSVAAQPVPKVIKLLQRHNES